MKLGPITALSCLLATVAASAGVIKPCTLTEADQKALNAKGVNWVFRGLSQDTWYHICNARRAANTAAAVAQAREDEDAKKAEQQLSIFAGLPMPDDIEKYVTDEELESIKALQAEAVAWKAKHRADPSKIAR